MEFLIAPLQSITSNVFREVHARHFTGVSAYYAPFISPTKDHIITPKQVGQIGLQHNRGFNLVPQVLVKNVDDFIWSVGALSQMGHDHVNLNLGCPAATVVTKGKGSAMLKDTQELDQFLSKSFGVLGGQSTKISVKTRLGFSEPAEFEQLLQIYNKYSLHTLIVHARVQQDLYHTPVRIFDFTAALAKSKNPICFNGDIVDNSGYLQICNNMPALNQVMIGRGIVADPALVQKLTGGKPVTKADLQNFLSDLFAAYSESYQSEANALLRMREVLAYHIHLFDRDDFNYTKKFGKMRTVAEYNSLINRLYQTSDLLDYPRPNWRVR